MLIAGKGITITDDGKGNQIISIDVYKLKDIIEYLKSDDEDDKDSFPMSEGINKQ